MWVVGTGKGLVELFLTLGEEPPAHRGEGLASKCDNVTVGEHYYKGLVTGNGVEGSAWSTKHDGRNHHCRDHSCADPTYHAVVSTSEDNRRVDWAPATQLEKNTHMML